MEKKEIGIKNPMTLKKEVSAVTNAIHILRHMAQNNAAEGVASIARATGVSPSSAFNILRTLTNEKLVDFDEKAKTYRLGLGLSEFVVSYIGRSYSDLIQPELDRLCLNRKILFVLWQVNGRGHIVSIASAKPNIAHISVKLQTKLPDLVGAAGRCIAAARHYTPAQLREGFNRLHWESPPNFDDYAQSVEQAKITGWSIDEGNLYKGITMIASVIYDSRGVPRFAVSGIGITAQLEQSDILQISEDIKETTAFLGRALFPQQELQ